MTYLLILILATMAAVLYSMVGEDYYEACEDCTEFVKMKQLFDTALIVLALEYALLTVAVFYLLLA